MNKKTTFSCVKDYDEQGKHLGEQPLRSMEIECDLDSFSLRNSKPTFPELEKLGVTRPLCQGEYYATLYYNYWGIASYSLYKITAAQATTPKKPRPKGDPWQPNLTPGKVISVVVIIYLCDEEIEEKNWFVSHSTTTTSVHSCSFGLSRTVYAIDKMLINRQIDRWVDR